MTPYRCHIQTPEGTRKTIEVQAGSFSEAFDILVSQGYTVEGIQAVDIDSPQLPEAEPTQPPNQGNLAHLLSGNSPNSNTEVAAGLQMDLGESISTLVPVLNAAGKEFTDHSLIHALETLTRRLSSKTHLGQLLRDPVTRQAVPLLLQLRSGKANAESILHWLNTWINARANQKRKHAPFAYPAIILGIGCIVFIFAATIVFPVFDEMYSEFSLQLPTATRVILDTGRQLTDHTLRTTIIIASAIVALGLTIRLLGPRVSSLPILGRLVHGSSTQLFALTNFTAVLAELLPQTPNLSVAIRIANQGCTERSLHRALTRFASSIEKNPDWINSDNPGPGVPATIVQTLKSVSRPSAQSAMLRRLSQIYQDRRSNRFNLFETIFPTIAVVAVGFLSGLIAILLFGPLLNLVQSLGL